MSSEDAAHLKREEVPTIADDAARTHKKQSLSKQHTLSHFRLSPGSPSLPGPVDTAILISICALGWPVCERGRDLPQQAGQGHQVRRGGREAASQELHDAESPEIEASTRPEERESFQQRRSTMALWSSLGLAALSGVLTSIGLVAALWHMAWWSGSQGS